MIVQQVDSEAILEEAVSFADSYRYDDAAGADLFPRTELTKLFKAGFSRAPLPVRSGGAGLGTDAGKHAALLNVLRELGRANLSLARIYEGHANAIILIFAFGSESQQEETSRACIEHKLFAVWNTDGRYPAHLSEISNGMWMLNGEKAFASAAGHADYCVLTANKVAGGRQMCLVNTTKTPISIDESAWNPLGMVGSGSFKASFHQALLSPSVFVGKNDDYYRPPLFLGGAIRASAIHLGGAEALLSYLRSYSNAMAQTGSPLLRRRAALIYAAIEEGRAWIDRAAETAERLMYLGAPTEQADEMNFTANIIRVAVEKICSEVIQLIIESVGARGLNRPYRFADVIRDLTMFLRQPDPDNCVIEAGRFVLENLHG